MVNFSRGIMANNLRTDIIIIGAGGAGLAATVAAAEKGAKVVILEKLNAPGGNSAMAQAFFAAESPAQKRLRIDAPRDILFKMAMDYAHWTINPRIIRAFIDKSEDTARWLEEELGLEPVTQINPFYPNQIIRTFHSPKGGGAGIIKVLLKACENRNIHLMRNTAGKKILTNSTREVTGVLAITKEGKEIEITARGVIIATGGFGGNKELAAVV